MRFNHVSVLEIGVLRGESLAMWAEYFREGRIAAIDLDPSAKQFETDRVRVEIADQGNVADLVRVATTHGPFDLVLDDGSHFWDHQITSFRYLFPFVKPGRFYILEDLDTSYGSYVAQYQHGAAESAAQYLQRMTDYMVGDAVIDIGREQDAFIRSYARRLEFITFARRTAIIKLRG
ncbi:MAG TPA: class I SAM-dependent methyltransferase [Acetobacteraceae bacterium]|nr:class I SAM-dependent methyltransferase [Acetobacteraceae bacterium]